MSDFKGDAKLAMGVSIDTGYAGGGRCQEPMSMQLFL